MDNTDPLDIAPTADAKRKLRAQLLNATKYYRMSTRTANILKTAAGVTLLLALAQEAAGDKAGVK